MIFIYGKLERMDEKTMNAFIFPGQGSQKSGMYYLLGNKANEVDEIFAIAQEASGYDVLSMCRDFSEEELKQTLNTQLSVTAMNMAYLRLLENRGIEPNIVAGHSLGQLSALTAAGVISVFDLFRLVGKRAELMSKVKESGKLATIIGLEKDVVNKVCEEVSKNKGNVKIALENATKQFVVGGREEDVSEVLKTLRYDKPLKIVEIQVSNAFHTYLMAPMVQPFREFVSSIEFHTPKTKILLNSKGGVGESVEEIREDVIKQCENTVKWVDCMKLLLAAEKLSVAEVGVGRMMSQLMKGINRKQKVYCLSNPEDFEQYLALWK